MATVGPGGVRGTSLVECSPCEAGPTEGHHARVLARSLAVPRPPSFAGTNRPLLSREARLSKTEATHTGRHSLCPNRN